MKSEAQVIGEDNINFRKGTAFDFRGQSDWTKATDCFSYGYKTGFNINKGSHVLLKGCGVDNVSSYIWKEHHIDNPENIHVLPGTIAYNMGDNDDLTGKDGEYVADYGTFGAPIIVDCQAAAHDIGFNIKLPGGQSAQFSGCQTWACQTGIKMHQTGRLTASNCLFEGTGIEDFVGLHSVDGGQINAVGCGFRLLEAGPNNETLATPQIKYKGNVTSSHENDGTFFVRSKETSGTTNTFTCGDDEYLLTTKMSDIAEADREGVANCLYQQVLGRAGDPGGLTWVIGRLGETLDSIIHGFVNGAEQPTTDPRVTTEYVEDTPIKITDDGVEITGDLKVNGETVNSSHQGIVNVDDFGAVGDGVTDDTKAIQDAIDSLVAPSIPPNWPQDEIDYFATLNMELTIAVYTLFRGGNITSTTGGVVWWATGGQVVQDLVRLLNGEVAATGKSFIEPKTAGGTVMLGNGEYLIDPDTTEEHWEPWPEYANYNGKTHSLTGQIPSNICLRSGQEAAQVNFNTQDCDEDEQGQLNDENHIVFQIFASFYGYTKFSDMDADTFETWRTRGGATSRQLIYDLIQKRRNENNSDLFIREGVTLKGVHANPSIAQWHTNSPGCRLIVGGKASIAMEKNSSLDGCYVMRKGIQDKVGNADDFAGYGIRPMGWDITISNCFVAGFEYGIYAHFGEFGPGELQRSNSVEGTTGRCNFRKVLMDNINGIVLHSCYEMPYIDGCECFPFLTFGSTNRTWPYEQHGQFRNGVAFSLRGHNDWTKITDCFSFGYMTGFEIDGGHNCSLRGCGADNLSGSHLKTAWIDAGSPNDENGLPLLRHQIPGTKAYKIWDGPTHNDPGPAAWGITDSHTLATSLVDCQAAAHEIGYFFHQKQEETTPFDNNGDTLQMTACQSWYCAESVRVVNGRLLVTNHYHNSQWPDISEGALYEDVPIEPIAFNQVGGQIDVIGCQLDRGAFDTLTENKNNAANIQKGAVTNPNPNVHVDDFGTFLVRNRPVDTFTYNGVDHPLTTTLGNVTEADREGLVNCIYQRVYGRDGDAGGVVWWAEQLTLTIDSIIDSFVGSQTESDINDPREVLRTPIKITDDGVEITGDLKVNGESISSSPGFAVGTDTFTTDEVDQIKLFLQYWEIDSNGNLLPKNDNSVDVGNAEQKVRDIYEQD